MATIPPRRAAARTLPFVAVVAIGFGGWLWVTGQSRAAVAATVVTLVLMGAAIGQAPARLAYRLEEFAGQVPGDPEASIAWQGDQTLEWPDLDLTVEGTIHRYRLQKFAVHTGDDVQYLPSTRPREAARIALAELDAEPAFEADSDRLPSLYPRLAGVKTGLLATFLAAILIALGGPLLSGGVSPLWWWALVPAVGVVAGAVRGLGLTRARRTYATLAEELRYSAGLEVDTIDRTDGRLSLDIVVHTTAGSIVTDCVALPYGRLTARHPTDPDDTVSTRLPDPTPVAARIGEWLR